MDSSPADAEEATLDFGRGEEGSGGGVMEVKEVKEEDLAGEEKDGVEGLSAGLLGIGGGLGGGDGAASWVIT